MYLESLHKKIKYQYFEGKVVKRLDIAIIALLKLVRDLMFDRIIKITKQVPLDKMKSIQYSHRKAILIPKENIELQADSNSVTLVKSMIDDCKLY